MAVNSANELHELIQNLSGQFLNVHQHAVNTLHTQADQHIQHVMNEGGTWITAEIRNLVDEWQTHLSALRAAEDWFAHHGPNLSRIAQDAERLSTEFFA